MTNREMILYLTGKNWNYSYVRDGKLYTALTFGELLYWVNKDPLNITFPNLKQLSVTEMEILGEVQMKTLKKTTEHLWDGVEDLKALSNKLNDELTHIGH